MPATKSVRRQLRVSAEDDALFRQAAEVAGETVTAFLVEGGRERAELLLADRTRFVLDEDAWQDFSAALDGPARRNEALTALLGRSRPE